MLNYYPGGGFVEVITGPMYAGKTKMFIERLTREKLAGKKVLVIKPNIDNRYATESVSTHDGIKMKAFETSLNSETIISHLPAGVTVVGIDEAQFFDEAIVDVVEALANAGIQVIVSGVDMDYRCQPFTNMGKILACAEIVHKLTAVCEKCGKEATKIQRFTNGELSSWNEPTIVVGSNNAQDSQKYVARCRNCWEMPPNN